MVDRVKILIVEDDDDSRHILSSAIKLKFGELDVYTARNGNEGLELFDRLSPELILTDLNMPELGGVQLAQEVRSRRPQTVLVAITAHSGQEVQEKCSHSDIDFDDYISKPIQFANVFAKIQASIISLDNQLRRSAAIR